MFKRKIIKYGKKLIRRLSSRLGNIAGPDMDVANMWGRVFDLNQKQRVQLEGFSLYVMPDDYIGASIMSSRTYEPHVTKVIRRELNEGEIFLDLGANIGYFSMLASSIVKNKGKVLAFEPNPQNLQLMYESKVFNKCSNLTIYPYAASDAANILRFTTVGSNGGVVSEHSVDQKHYLLVQAVVIDEILRDEKRMDLIKMDIEAHEPAALRGMEKLLRRLKPKLITEFHPWAMRLNNTEPPEDFLMALENLDYQLSVILPDGNLGKMRSTEDIMKYWQLIGSETAHLDLFADPISH